MAAALAVLARSEAASADESGTSTGAAAIVVTFDPSAVEQERVVAAVRAHLSGLPVRVLVRPVASSPSVGQSVATAGELARTNGALGTFSIELGEDGAFLIFFTEPGGTSTLIRRLPPSEQGVRVTVEEAAIVVRSLVLALLEGRRIGMASAADSPVGTKTAGTVGPPSERRADGTATRPEQTAGPEIADEVPGPASGDEPSERPEAHTVAFTAAYAGTDFATNVTWQSGFTLGVRWVALRPLYAAARYTFFPELEGGTNETAVSITRHPGELVAGYMGSTRLAANAEVGLVLDYTSRETQGSSPAFEPTPPSNRWTVAVGARAGASFAIVPIVQLALRGGADFLVTSYAYVVPDGAEVVSPHRIRPRLDLELATSLW